MLIGVKDGRDLLVVVIELRREGGRSWARLRQLMMVLVLVMEGGVRTVQLLSRGGMSISWKGRASKSLSRCGG